MAKRFEKIRDKILDSENASLLFDCGGLRLMIICSIILLLLYSLVFHHFVIILVLLFQVVALMGTFT